MSYNSDFFAEEGYVVFQPQATINYFQRINDCFQYYSDQLNVVKRTKSDRAFLNRNGSPRHLINLLGDNASPAARLILKDYIANSVRGLIHDQKRYYITHSKLSFKTFGESANWYPHQDNSYKLNGCRKGFAVLVCLEDMSSCNGCLCVYPRSHLKGLLPHQKVVENNSSDAQLSIIDIPDDLKPLEICAPAGSFVVFDQNCIHYSLDTMTSSKRLAIIFEVEEFGGHDLDDYGNVPALISGHLTPLEKLLLVVRSPFSFPKLMAYVRKKPAVRMLLRVAIRLFPSVKSFLLS